jgi:PAS domain S-box-containing protein
LNAPGTQPEASPKLLPQSESDIAALINAFRYFNETATTLSASYQRLEARLGDLGRELEEKDRQLYSRLRELDRVTRYLNSLVESLSTGVLAIDLEGNITIINKAASDLIGVSPEEAIGQFYRTLIPQDPTVSGALKTLIEGPEQRGIERKFPAAAHPVISQTAWVVDSLGDRIGVMELFDDAGVIRGLEEQIEHQKTLSALGEMAASVAHELRNPLAGISGFALLLNEELADNPRLKSMAEAVLQGVRNLEKIASNLLFLTRRTALEHQELDVQSLIQETEQLLRSECIMLGCEVEINVRVPRERIKVVSDPILLRVILTNLSRNALQAIGRKGRIDLRLTWKLLTNRLDLTISDDGCGIPKENIHKLFSPFFTTKDRGTGLGLALVKKAVDLLSGEISVESTVGVGTTFTVSLPLLPGVSDTGKIAGDE